MAPLDDSDGFEALRARNQVLLSDLVSIDLDLAHTFLEMAKGTDNPEHEQRTVAYARNALEAVRRLFCWVENPDWLNGFEKRADELQTAIRAAERDRAPTG